MTEQEIVVYAAAAAGIESSGVSWHIRYSPQTAAIDQQGNMQKVHIA